MPLLSRDQILAADDIKTETVDVPEWGEGGQVRVRAMSGAARDEFEASLMERHGRRTVTNTANIRAKLVSLCVVDEAGKRLFTPQDVELLGRKSAAALDRIYEKAAKLSGISDEDVEALTENFGGAPGESSSSSSPNDSE